MLIGTAESQAIPASYIMPESASKLMGASSWRALSCEMTVTACAPVHK